MDKKSLEELETRLRGRVKDWREEDGRGLRMGRVRDDARRQDDTTQEADLNSKPTNIDEAGKSNSATVREAVPTPESDVQAMGQRLQLSDVIASTYRAFPLLEIARLQAGVTAGQQTSALGAYDVKLEYYSLNQPVSFYENYQNGIGVARQLWWGGYASAGYRIGRGSFEPWYKERETNGGGEFKVGLMQPLLQGRAIDPYRVELFQANLRRQAVGPEIQNQILMAGQDAAKAFWLWVEIGNVLKAQERLLEIAVKRGEQLVRTKAAGAASNLELSLNAQQIAERQLKVNDTKQKFLDTAIKLSLFLRDEGGNPMLVPPEWLPSDFPEIGTLPVGDFDADLQTALTSRPELSLIELDRQSTRWDLTIARNQLLPSVDFALQTTQDVGSGASSINDKGDFQVEAGVTGGVPIQRRKASGKILSTEQKLMQISQKAMWQRNKIEVELRTARNALDTAQRNVVTAQKLLKEANITLDIFRKSLEVGRTDLFFLLTQEIKVNDSEVKLLEAERDFFIALAAMQAALGLDPLEQATGLVAP
ncbi:MAG: TolC family protein [Planctomycetota bacterium]|nr:TolC family protein [Planctomycetota bacterium]